MSLIAVVLLAAAVVLVVAAEWPRLTRGHTIVPRFPHLRRHRRKPHLRVVQPDEESDEFARSVERDLANLPTYDPRAKRD